MIQNFKDHLIVEEGKFNARVIQRELAMITHLMTKDNFENVKRDDGWMNNYSVCKCILAKLSSRGW